MHILPLGRSMLAASLFFLSSICPSTAKAIESTTVDTLASEPYWRTLLHFKTALIFDQSAIDDSRFFLSPQGKHDAAAELTATIHAFSTGDPSEATHPINRYPARLRWLLENLPAEISSNFVAKQSAPFETMWTNIEPRSASVIFPSQYMNNPASLFGHTLINIEGKRNEKLLAYSINYSAITEETNGVIFAAKGLIGAYEGRFSVDPYYQKVQQYSDLSMRDIWEYNLNLNHDEVRNMMMHFWELQGIYSYYYFFDENCSYNLLFLLDAARPGSTLAQQFNTWVIPVDTIKVIRNDGFIKSEHYRPSRSTKIKRIATTLPAELQQRCLEATTDTDASIALTDSLDSHEDKIRTLDLSAELLKMYHADGDISKEVYAAHYIGILKQRAKLGKVDDDFYPQTTPSPPHEGHNSGRISTGFGSYDSWSVVSLSLRPAYHDLMDPSTGYTMGSAIEFLSGELYYYTDEQKLEIRQLDFISIQSLSPIDTFFKSKSWKVNTGLTTIKEESSDDRHTAFYFDSGIGLSVSLLEDSIAYALVEPAAYFNKSLDSSHMIGGGGVIGLLSQWSPNWRSQFELRQRHYFLGEDNDLTEFTAKVAYTVNEDIAVEISFGRSQEFDQNWNEFNCSMQFFF